MANVSVESMKPHLRLKHHVWSCTAPMYGTFVMGFGYTAKAAWDDFIQRIAR